MDVPTKGGEPGESTAQRLTRNLNELLQELRVTQTGVQILTGFLLTVPFSPRFEDLDLIQRRGYLAVLCSSVLATAFIVAPVAFHRVLFRGGHRPWLVQAAHRCARVGLGLLALASVGVLWLVFDVTTTRTAGLVAGVVGLLCFVTLWFAVPVLAARGPDYPDEQASTPT